jgi:uncharacterized protein YbjQ (UPF0145 family)
MLITTTATLQDRAIREYLGLVTGEAIIGANIFRDVFAGLRDIVGGRAGSYEEVLREAREAALAEMTHAARAMGADAILGVDLDYETVSQGTMLMVAVSGTAVRLG